MQPGGHYVSIFKSTSVRRCLFGHYCFYQKYSRSSLYELFDLK